MPLTNHPAKHLWNSHSPSAYPDGVIPVPEPIPGTAFFPGGYGLWGTGADVDLPEFPVGGVMILGHDFHSEVGYKASLRKGTEPETQPTWRKLLEVLRGADIPLEKCFFTNFYVGLREGDEATGPFPGARNKNFVQHCTKFFVGQLTVMRPSTIVTLGKYVPGLIAPLSRELAAWRDSDGFRQIDIRPVAYDCRFDGVSDFETTVVALVHPSMRHASVGIRQYGGLRGNDAETAMLRNALHESMKGT